MPIMYHGTDEKTAQMILEKGFKEGTFFARHMEDAVYLGGLDVFQVWLDEYPTKYWEWISDRVISVSAIRSLDHFEAVEVYSSAEVERRIREANILKEHGDDKVICDNCAGRGQMEITNRLVRLKAHGKITACEVCGGHGYVDKHRGTG